MGAPETQQALDASAIEDALKLCKREISNKNDAITELLLDCVVELSPKMPIYALLIGLINVEEPHWCGDLIDTAASMLASSLSSPQPADHDRARLLLRLLCCLSAANVLQSSGCMALLEAMVASSNAAMTSDAPHRHLWQPWSDWMVYCVVAALPWAGSELSAACPSEMARLSEAIDAYLEKRPVSFSQELKPFRAEIKEGDIAMRNDSGGASYLSGLWAAVKECATVGWHVESIPQLLNEEQTGSQYSSRLAMGQTHAVPHVPVPESPSGLPSADPAEPHPLQVAAAVQQAYPPHGGIRLLEPQHTDGGRPAIDRFVAEDYIIDTLAAFDADRTQCVKRLVSSLMLPYNYTNLLSEVLFGQMLALPRPRLPSMAYCTVIVDLCRVMCPCIEVNRAWSLASPVVTCPEVETDRARQPYR
ncbi:armadillo-type protein [Dunaliella salina]|uniref:Armadillo-type protein n=1 Tax=Dunaliella salina TaxID=3046 RepID=A0ABQ7G3M3_DUNSA|nr:armadillo-type protein [Dunaliella salina]|eukprot:KAF5829207.1 armadillo-type protein [Dunaliella salina]